MELMYDRLVRQLAERNLARDEAIIAKSGGAVDLSIDDYIAPAREDIDLILAALATPDGPMRTAGTNTHHAQTSGYWDNGMSGFLFSNMIGAVKPS